jgi:xanthine dehydrogenase/oxidase
VLTTEGLGGSTTSFNDIQSILADNNGSQCGFCTPGWIMAAAGFLTSAGTKDEKSLEDWFDGNLCRCTGYRPIIESFKKLLSNTQDKQASKQAAKMAANAGKEGCTGSCSTCTACDDDGDDGCGCGDIEDMYGIKAKSSCCKSTSAAPKQRTPPVVNAETGATFYAPNDNSELVSALTDIYSSGRTAQIIAGNTGSGVSKYYNSTAPYNRALYSNTVVSVSAVAELRQIAQDGAMCTMGCAVTLADMIAFFSAHSYPAFNAAGRHVGHIANTQVRSSGTWAGNLTMATLYPDFPSDMYLTFIALDARITYRTTSMDVLSNIPVVQFVTNPQFRENCVMLLAVSFPVPSTAVQAATVARRFKQTQRARNAHAHVNLFAVGALSPSGVLSNVRVSVGGVVNAVSLCPKTALIMASTPVTSEGALQQTLSAFTSELQSLGINSNPDLLVSQQYLVQSAVGCMFKFFSHCVATLTGVPNSASVEEVPRPVTSGVQSFGINADSLPVTAPVPKIGARLQASGEALYAQDHAAMVDPRTGLHGAFVFSTQACKTLVGIDTASIRQLPGVRDVLSAVDIQGTNEILSGEHLFLPIGEIVPCVGYPVAMVLSGNADAANKLAAEASRYVSYGASGDAMPPIYSLEDAMKYGSLYEDFSPPSVHKGSDSDDALSKSANRISGRITTGGQKHFYFETHATVAIPVENGCIEVRSSTQDLTTTQGTVSKVLGVASNKVKVTQKRAGGGYGGKLTRCLPTSCAASVAAKKHNTTVSVVANRNTDIQMIGGREPMCVDYDVGYDNTGKLTAVKVHLHVEAGCTMDGSGGSAEMGMLWSDHAYNVESFDCTATLYKTNLPTNTSCRSPGNIQSCYAMEEVLYRISENLNIDIMQLQELNMYKSGDSVPKVAHVPLGTTLKDVTLQRCWSELKDVTNHAAKLEGIEAFNRSNKYRKRGIATVPVKYGINGAGYKQLARISIYADDGTVHVAHSGAEIGQGIDTKVVQCISYALGVDMEKIEVTEMSTFNSPNTGGTGGSATSEVVSQAALNACDDIMSLMKSCGYSKGDGWEAWLAAVQKADGKGPLAFQGWSNPPMLSAFGYYVWCASQCVVELDVLTGECVVLSADIQYDCGEQLNADVDIGQIEGAFVMGLGYFLTERVEYGRGGELLTNGTWEYKPPCAQDVPAEFNVRLLQGVGNDSRQGVLRSKATGEPPMISSACCWFAVRDAVKRARADLGKAGAVELRCPATIDARLEALGLGKDDLKL